MAKTTFFGNTNITTTTNTKTEGKTTIFSAVLVKAVPIIDTDKEGKQKISVLLTFTVTGHPYRSEYSKKVSKDYIEDMFGVFNSYLKTPLTELDADDLLWTLLDEKPSMMMWSTSVFDKRTNQYRTNSSFYPKRD